MMQGAAVLCQQEHRRRQKQPDPENQDRHSRRSAFASAGSCLSCGQTETFENIRKIVGDADE
jgi:hypothetical protein